MDAFRNPIDKFIEELGGTVEIALLTGVSPSVVSSWRINGRIPEWRQKPVMALARKRGIEFPGNAPKKPRAPRKAA